MKTQYNSASFQPDTPPFDELVCDDWLRPASAWLCPLDGFSLIRVSGSDAFAFLNNQLTNDLKEVSEEFSQFSGYCNPKGRLYATFRVYLDGGDYCLLTPADNAAAAADRLRMFVLRADVTVEVEAANGLALIGPGANRLLADAGLPVPAAAPKVARQGETRVVCQPGICERYEVYAPPDALQGLWETLVQNPASSAAPAPANLRRLYDVLSGIPNVYAQTRELFVPQMVNFDLIGGVSFTKGCYPGQEVVARTHYLGKLKRRMYQFVLPVAADTVSPGLAVYVPAYSAEQPSGEVVDACALPDGTVHGLASLRIQGLEQGDIRLGAPDGANAWIVPLPYEVTAESQDPSQSQSQDQSQGQPQSQSQDQSQGQSRGQSGQVRPES